MLSETAIISIIIFSLFVIVTQFVMILILFLKNKSLRAKLHNKTFEDLIRQNLMTENDRIILER